ncbi:MAG: class I SAM-dependent methyltransferase [Nanoarchaeota archaeon]|nr:class I SAM-dependent methyltransferase [Nanoarchaeota archaeon]
MQNNECLGDKNFSKKHWENIYNLKNFNEVSWYQESPKTSIDLIQSVDPDKNAYIIDVGGGNSNLVDNLIELGFKNIFVLDISLKALEKSKQRLNEKSKTINWINSDIKEFKTNEKFDIWHDRALFHFLISEEDIKKYIESVNRFLKPAGYLIIATFSLKGPKKCSGLDTKQYSEDSIRKIFNKGFEYIKSFEEIHNTPFNTTQSFIWNVFKKL